MGSKTGVFCLTELHNESRKMYNRLDQRGEHFWDLVVLMNERTRYAALSYQVKSWGVHNRKPGDVLSQLIGRPCRVGVKVRFDRQNYIVVGIHIEGEKPSKNLVFRSEFVGRVNYLALLPAECFNNRRSRL